MTRPNGRIQQLVGRVLDRPFPYGYFRIFTTSPLTQKNGERLALLPIAPRFCFAYFVIVCALLPPDLFMQTAPRKYFRGAVTSAFFISNYLHFIFRHNLSCYFYLTVIYLKLPVIFNLKTGDIFIRKSKRGKDRLRYAIPSFAKNHISQALSGWSMWLFVGLFCNTPVFLPIF